MFYMIYAWTGNCADLLCTAQNVHVMAWVFRYFLFYLIDYNIVPCVTLHFLSLSLLLPLFLLTFLHHTLCILESVFPSFFVGSFVFCCLFPGLMFSSCLSSIAARVPPVSLVWTGSFCFLSWIPVVCQIFIACFLFCGIQLYFIKARLLFFYLPVSVCLDAFLAMPNT